MFLDTNQFSFVRDLEASWTMVRDECLGLPESTFEPWVQREMYGEGVERIRLRCFRQSDRGGIAILSTHRCPLDASPRTDDSGIFSHGCGDAHPAAHRLGSVSLSTAHGTGGAT